MTTYFQIAFQKGEKGSDKISQVAKWTFIFESQESKRNTYGICFMLLLFLSFLSYFC